MADSTWFGWVPRSTNENNTESISELLTGRAYKLSAEDLQEIIISDNIRGGPWLTDPYNMSNLPFVTVQISAELGSLYVVERPQILWNVTAQSRICVDWTRLTYRLLSIRSGEIQWCNTTNLASRAPWQYASPLSLQHRRQICRGAFRISWLLLRLYGCRQPASQWFRGARFESSLWAQSIREFYPL